jgi:hypothetical protein
MLLSFTIRQQSKDSEILGMKFLDSEILGFEI